MDMARLRCGTNDLAISKGRRGLWRAPVVRRANDQQRSPPTCVPEELRVCTWCEDRLQQPDMQAVRGAYPVPVEDEEHVLLWCGLYRQLRSQLFDTVHQLTDVRGDDGRHVLRQGPVDLRALTGSLDASGTRVDAALAVVMGGLHCTQLGAVKCTEQQRRVDNEVRQACKQFLGRVMQQRREWQEQQRQRRRQADCTLTQWILRAESSLRSSGMLQRSASSRPASRRRGRKMHGGRRGGGRSNVNEQWVLGRKSPANSRGDGRDGSRTRADMAITSRAAVRSVSAITSAGRNRVQRRLRLDDLEVVGKHQLEHADGSRQLPITRYLTLPSRLQTCHRHGHDGDDARLLHDVSTERPHESDAEPAV
jgi:hypothetical protein